MTDFKRKFIVIAKIGARHGFRGFYHAYLYVDNTSLILSKELWLLSENNKPINIQVINLKPYKKESLLIQFLENDFENKQKLPVLTNCYLGIKQDQLPKLESDSEYYYHELANMLLYVDNNRVGQVLQVVNFGSATLLEVKLKCQLETIYLPFVEELILAIDCQDKIIKLNPNSVWYKALELDKQVY